MRTPSAPVDAQEIVEDLDAVPRDG
jgi:hypothetical protein